MQRDRDHRHRQGVAQLASAPGGGVTEALGELQGIGQRLRRSSQPFRHRLAVFAAVPVFAGVALADVRLTNDPRNIGVLIGSS